VAIDQASIDLVNQEAALPESSLTTNRAAGEDKFRGIYPRWTGRISSITPNRWGSAAGRICWKKFKLA